MKSQTATAPRRPTPGQLGDSPRQIRLEHDPELAGRDVELTDLRPATSPNHSALPPRTLWKTADDARVRRITYIGLTDNSTIRRMAEAVFIRTVRFEAAAGAATRGR
jgi:hypothetical protein